MALLSDTDPDPTPRRTLCCDSTVGAYKHSDPEKKGKKERREIKDRTRRSGSHLNNQFKHGSKRGNNSIHVSLTPADQRTAGFEPCDERRLAEHNSPVLTAQKTQPAYKNWPRGELWRFYPTWIQIRLHEAHYAVTPRWEPTNIATRRRKERRREEY